MSHTVDHIFTVMFDLRLDLLSESVFNSKALP